MPPKLLPVAISRCTHNKMNGYIFKGGLDYLSLISQMGITTGKNFRVVPLRVTGSKYRKNSKIWGTSNNCRNCPKIEKFDVKDADGMANSIDSDQTASEEAV